MHRSLLLQASLLGCLVCVAPRVLAADAAAAPADAAKDKADEKGWITLFDGKTFEGWTPNENKTTWTIENGELITHGERCHLFYTGKVQNHVFKNFELKLDIMTKPHSNSGVYLHTKYQDTGFPANGVEVQVNNTHQDPRKTAGLYAIQDIMNDSPAKDDEWFTMDVTVKDMCAIVKINDKVVNDYKQPKNPPNDPGKENNHFTPAGGTIALQGHDPGSEVHYRNIRIKPLP
jgi:Domain of Unknown Function (DUF1080)